MNIHYTSEEITQLLNSVRKGSEIAYNQLFPLVYRELKSMAQKIRLKWQSEHTLNTTALVHEVYLKMFKQDDLNLENRAHFFGVAARAMRFILINYLERKTADKRGGNIQHESLENMEYQLSISPEVSAELMSLENALKTLENKNNRFAKVVECRFYGGLTIEETAKALHLSIATVKRDWALCKAWLYKELKSS